MGFKKGCGPFIVGPYWGHTLRKIHLSNEEYIKSPPSLEKHLMFGTELDSKGSELSLDLCV